jgi:hypothetical protein
MVTWRKQESVAPVLRLLSNSGFEEVEYRRLRAYYRPLGPGRQAMVAI